MNKIKEALVFTRTLLASPSLLAPLCAACAVLALVQSVRVEHHRTEISAETAAAETALERMHSMGYESGYQSAIVDAYTDSARYLIEEGTSGAPVMWKKVEIEEPNLSTLQSRLDSRDQEPLATASR
jgi:hypothetical protein